MLKRKLQSFVIVPTLQRYTILETQVRLGFWQLHIREPINKFKYKIHKVGVCSNKTKYLKFTHKSSKKTLTTCLLGTNTPLAAQAT